MGSVKNILTKEIKAENYILVFLSVVSMVLGFLIMLNILTVSSEFELLAKNPNVFAWILVGVGIAGLILGVYKITKQKEKC